MKYFCKINEQDIELSVNRETDEIYVNGSEDSAQTDLVKIDDGLYHLLLENKSYLISVTNKNIYFRTSIEGDEYQVEIEDNISRLKSMFSSTETDDKDFGKVHSPMPGLVVKIFVNVGDHVELNSPLIALEAMKMENEIKSPKKGEITDINVTLGQRISTETLLMTIG